MPETQSSDSISTKLRRIAELARKYSSQPLTTLAHHIDIEWLQEAVRRTRKDGAPGIDGQTACNYMENLPANMQALLERVKTGQYRAPAVRRVHIPKGTGPETRPIGIPTFEDKVLQRAVAMILEAIYEEIFVEGSYGFRPGRSCHQALDAFWHQAMEMNGGWVLELDIRKFFDTVDRRRLMETLEQRIRDGVILRLVSKWLHAGVMEGREISFPERGTPQGGVISPVLANIYLHTVLDTWFRDQVQPRLRGKAFLNRFADDAVLVFEREDDARRVFEVLAKRFEKFGLTLHPDKTRLVDFQTPAVSQGSGGPRKSGPRGDAPPRTFDFLGFTHFWGRSRRGPWVVKRKTSTSRFSRTVRRIGEWCRLNRHRPLRLQHQAFSAKLRGHYAYFGITGNSAALAQLGRIAQKIWHKWLNRRSQRRSLSWARFNSFLQRFPLPRPTPIHSVLCRGAKP